MWEGSRRGPLSGLQSERPEETRDRAERGSVVRGSAGASVAPERDPSRLTGATISNDHELSTCKLVCDARAVVHFTQRLDDSLRVDAHGAADLGREDESVRDAFDVGIEDQPDDLAVLVDNGAARVAADDVVGRDEVVWGVEVETVLPLHPPLRKPE